MQESLTRERHSPGRPGRASIIWMLVAVFALLAVHPVHFHLWHNESSAADAEHVMQLHARADLDRAQLGDRAHTVDPLSSSTLKSSGFHLLWFAFLLGVLLLLPGKPPAPRVAAAAPRPSLRRHELPPLRAPPRL